MTVLSKLLEEVTTPNETLTNQVRKLCDIISDEEKETIKYDFLLPKGPTIFLSLEAPGRNNKEIGFLTLEREDEEIYVIVYYTLEKYKIHKEDIEKTIPPRRRKVWVINENKAEKILTQYAKKLKIIRGE